MVFISRLLVSHLRKGGVFAGLAIAALPCSAESTYTVHEGKLVSSEEVPDGSVQEHFSTATKAFEKKEWNELISQALIIIKNFPSSPFAQEAYFYLGVGYFHTGDLERANKQLGIYLKRQTPLHFEEAIQYKFSIAEQYNSGAKKPLLGWDVMPRWVPAREDAIAIYDEVIAALPHHDLGAQALYGKARLLFRDSEYKTSIETFQSLIRRFPKHPLCPESYVGIAEVYLEQAKMQYPDPDFLSLAEINFKKFNQEFPKESRLGVAEEYLDEMKEIYANNFYEIGKFYERTSKFEAAAIYFQQVLDRYPETMVADLSEKRLIVLQDKGVFLPKEIEDSPSYTASGIPSDEIDSIGEEQRRTIPPISEPEAPHAEDKRTIPPITEPDGQTEVENKRQIPPIEEPDTFEQMENKRRIPPIEEPGPEDELQIKML